MDHLPYAGSSNYDDTMTNVVVGSITLWPAGVDGLYAMKKSSGLLPTPFHEKHSPTRRGPIPLQNPSHVGHQLIRIPEQPRRHVPPVPFGAVYAGVEKYPRIAIHQFHDGLPAVGACRNQNDHLSAGNIIITIRIWPPRVDPRSAEGGGELHPPLQKASSAQQHSMMNYRRMTSTT